MTNISIAKMIVFKQIRYEKFKAEIQDENRGIICLNAELQCRFIQSMFDSYNGVRANWSISLAEGAYPWYMIYSKVYQRRKEYFGYQWHMKHFGIY